MLFLVILLSCRTNPKLCADKKESLGTANEQKRQSVIDTLLINEYLKEPDFDKRVLDYCQGNFKISDDEKSFAFLDFITQKNEKLNLLYFSIFNQICECSDGSLSEVLGKYCFKVIVNQPNEVFRHFETNNKDLKRYASLLGYEFYFSKKGTSDLEMNFEQLKEFLTKELNMNDKKILDTYNLFCTETENAIKKMD